MYHRMIARYKQTWIGFLSVTDNCFSEHELLIMTEENIFHDQLQTLNGARLEERTHDWLNAHSIELTHMQVLGCTHNMHRHV